MSIEDLNKKAKLIADQCKPCSKDFYSGIYQGVIIALKAEHTELNPEEIEEVLNKYIYIGVDDVPKISTKGIKIVFKSQATEIEKLKEENERLKSIEFEKCNHCNGDGYTSEHDPQDPHENGCCSNCPIQVQCDKCRAKGFVEKGSQ